MATVGKLYETLRIVGNEEFAFVAANRVRMTFNAVESAQRTKINTVASFPLITEAVIKTMGAVGAGTVVNAAGVRTPMSAAAKSTAVQSLLRLDRNCRL